MKLFFLLTVQFCIIYCTYYVNYLYCMYYSLLDRLLSESYPFYHEETIHL